MPISKKKTAAIRAQVQREIKAEARRERRLADDRPLKHVVISCPRWGHFAVMHSRDKEELVSDVQGFMRHDAEMRKAKCMEETTDSIVIIAHDGRTHTILHQTFSKFKTTKQLKQYLHFHGFYSR